MPLETALSLTPLADERCRELTRALRGGALDASTIDLVRRRVAMLLRCEPTFAVGWTDDDPADATKVANLAQWPSSPLFDGRERAALAFTEQFVIDPSGVTDDDAARWRRELTDAELTALTTAVAVFDALGRAQIALAHLDERAGTASP
jgi:alkylhydroperoxidase family enzyme